MKLDTANVATILVLVMAAVGAAIVVLSATDVVSDPQMRLTFNGYIEAMAIASGGLAIGRGLASSPGPKKEV